MECNAIEQIQTRAIRTFLGVHRFTPIPALYGDTGWVSCFFRRQTHIFRFWNRLVKMPDNRLTKLIFNADYNTRSNFTWCSNVKKLFSGINLVNIFNEKNMCDMNSVDDSLKLLFEANWRAQVMSKPKLRTYQLFKKDFGKECYISQNLNKKLRSMLAQLRFGILPLQIETDRFRNIALQERICCVCDLNQVESVIHFLFICPMYNILRNQWVKWI